MIGRMLKLLDESEHAKNTIVVFWSDNGWHLGEKQHWHKSTLWQRSTHVPLIIAGPGLRSTGKARHQPVNLLDLYPTLVEMCNLPAKTGLDGESLVPLLRNPNARRKPTVITFGPGNHAVRSERWRYIRYADGTEELYDAAADPNEFRNLAPEEKYTSLKREFAQLMPKMSAPPKPERDAYNFDFKSHTWELKRG
jgi:arylsulfatase A-like enzyme